MKGILGTVVKIWCQVFGDERPVGSHRVQPLAAAALPSSALPTATLPSSALPAPPLPAATQPPTTHDNHPSLLKNEILVGASGTLNPEPSSAAPQQQAYSDPQHPCV